MSSGIDKLIASLRMSDSKRGGGRKGGPSKSQRSREPSQGVDDEEQPSTSGTTREAGGAEQAPAGPPSRTPNLTPEEQDEALARYQTVAARLDEQADEATIFHIYATIKAQAPEQMEDADTWLTAVKEVLDTEARNQIREAPSIFSDQMFHLLNMCNLPPRSWNLLSTTINTRPGGPYFDRCKLMVYACRYQGFDPSVILRKIIRSWREEKLKPRVSMTLHYEGKNQVYLVNVSISTKICLYP